MRTILLDANVLVSSWTLDVIMCLADAGLLRPMWSEPVLEEYARALERLGRVHLARSVEQSLRRSYPYALVEDWERHLNRVELPDPDDRHVVAAAIAGECDFVVTYNLRDFPQDVLESVGLCVFSPDDLLMDLVGRYPVKVLTVIEGLIASKKHPPRTYDAEIEGLRHCGLLRFAEWLDS